MCKAFIAQIIQSSADVTGVAANMTAGEVISGIVAELSNRGKFTLPGFGTFTVCTTKARAALNPRTGAAVRVAAGKTVRFKVSPALRKLV